MNSKSTVLRFSIMHLVCVIFVLGIFVIRPQAESLSGGSQQYRNQVLNVAGIARDDNLYEPINRGDFAKMLVLSSPSKDSVGTGSIAAANDVPASYENAQYVRIALRNSWMRTKLNGNFEPYAPVTIADAAKAVMTMLGYQDSDFEGSIAANRLAKFQALGLDDGLMSSNSSDVLSKQDAMNIIYNLLRTNTKNGSAYGTGIKLSVSSDGELNTNNLMDQTLVGPILIKSVGGIAATLPFKEEEAVFYYNGKQYGFYGYADLMMHSQIQQLGWLILYYNEPSKTVWAYGSSDSRDSYTATRGIVNQIYYSSNNIANPEQVTVDGTTYNLSGSEVKFMLSMYGSIKVGDDVILILKPNTTVDSEGLSSTDYSAVGIICYAKAQDGTTIGTMDTTVIKFGKSAGPSGDGNNSNGGLQPSGPSQSSGM